MSHIHQHTAATSWTQAWSDCTDIIMNNITTAITILLTIALCVHPGKSRVPPPPLPSLVLVLVLLYGIISLNQPVSKAIYDPPSQIEENYENRQLFRAELRTRNVK